MVLTCTHSTQSISHRCIKPGMSAIAMCHAHHDLYLVLNKDLILEFEIKIKIIKVLRIKMTDFHADDPTLIWELLSFVKLASQRDLSLLLLHSHSRVTCKEKDQIKLVIMGFPPPSPYGLTLGFQE